MNVNDKLQSSVVGALLNSSALYRISEGGQIDSKANYTLNSYLDDVFSEMFKPTYQGIKLSAADMNIQSAAVGLMINSYNYDYKEETVQLYWFEQNC